MPEAKATRDPQERLFLVYVNPDESEDEVVEQELEGLVEAAGGVVAGMTRQRLSRPHKRSYIGSGKVEEVKLYALEAEADTVVVDTELSGIQLRNLEEAWGVRVLDRTSLILDIFAGRAKTREGQLQVELAQLTYRLPRLMSIYTKFERQRGGIGMRGPGETQLESDRRMINARIAKLKLEIDNVKQHRQLNRATRQSHPIPTLSLVGYTSAGKSTLMNRLCQTTLLADAMPFATLDPTTRRVDGEEFSFFLTDTVGFIRNLPTQLVAAFRATLEETLVTDLLIHVVDVSHPDWEGQRDAVIQTIEGIGGNISHHNVASNSTKGSAFIPMLTVFNKIDALPDQSMARRLVAEWPNSVAISALTGEGVEELQAVAHKILNSRTAIVSALIPYEKSSLVESCHKFGKVHKEEYREDGILIEAEVVPEWAARLAAYAIRPV